MRVGPNAQYWPPKKRTHAFDGDEPSVRHAFSRVPHAQLAVVKILAMWACCLWVRMAWSIQTPSSNFAVSSKFFRCLCFHFSEMCFRSCHLKLPAGSCGRGQGAAHNLLDCMAPLWVGEGFDSPSFPYALAGNISLQVYGDRPIPLREVLWQGMVHADRRIPWFRGPPQNLDHGSLLRFSLSSYNNFCLCLSLHAI